MKILSAQEYREEMAKRKQAPTTEGSLAKLTAEMGSRPEVAAIEQRMEASAPITDGRIPVPTPPEDLALPPTWVQSMKPGQAGAQEYLQDVQARFKARAAEVDPDATKGAPQAVAEAVRLSEAGQLAPYEAIEPAIKAGVRDVVNQRQLNVYQGQTPSALSSAGSTMLSVGKALPAVAGNLTQGAGEYIVDTGKELLSIPKAELTNEDIMRSAQNQTKLNVALEDLGGLANATERTLQKANPFRREDDTETWSRHIYEKAGDLLSRQDVLAGKDGAFTSGVENLKARGLDPTQMDVGRIERGSVFMDPTNLIPFAGGSKAVGMQFGRTAAKETAEAIAKTAAREGAEVATRQAITGWELAADATKPGIRNTVAKTTTVPASTPMSAVERGVAKASALKAQADDLTKQAVEAGKAGDMELMQRLEKDAATASAKAAKAEAKWVGTDPTATGTRVAASRAADMTSRAAGRLEGYFRNKGVWTTGGFLLGNAPGAIGALAGSVAGQGISNLVKRAAGNTALKLRTGTGVLPRSIDAGVRATKDVARGTAVGGAAGGATMLPIVAVTAPESTQEEVAGTIAGGVALGSAGSLLQGAPRIAGDIAGSYRGGQQPPPSAGPTPVAPPVEPVTPPPAETPFRLEQETIPRPPEPRVEQLELPGLDPANPTKAPTPPPAKVEVDPAVAAAEAAAAEAAAAKTARTEQAYGLQDQISAIQKDIDSLRGAKGVDASRRAEMVKTQKGLQKELDGLYSQGIDVRKPTAPATARPALTPATPDAPAPRRKFITDEENKRFFDAEDAPAKQPEVPKEMAEFGEQKRVEDKPTDKLAEENRIQEEKDRQDAKKQIIDDAVDNIHAAAGGRISRVATRKNVNRAVRALAKEGNLNPTGEELMARAQPATLGDPNWALGEIERLRAENPNLSHLTDYQLRQAQKGIPPKKTTDTNAPGYVESDPFLASVDEPVTAAPEAPKAAPTPKAAAAPKPKASSQKLTPAKPEVSVDQQAKRERLRAAVARMESASKAKSEASTKAAADEANKAAAAALAKSQETRKAAVKKATDAGLTEAMAEKLREADKLPNGKLENPFDKGLQPTRTQVYKALGGPELPKGKQPTGEQLSALLKEKFGSLDEARKAIAALSPEPAPKPQAPATKKKWKDWTKEGVGEEDATPAATPKKKAARKTAAKKLDPNNP